MKTIKLSAIESKEVMENGKTEMFIGTCEIVGFNPTTREVYIVNNCNHYYVNGISCAKAWSADEWNFITETLEKVEF